MLLPVVLVLPLWRIGRLVLMLLIRVFADTGDADPPACLIVHHGVDSGGGHPPWYRRGRLFVRNDRDPIRRVDRSRHLHRGQPKSPSGG